MHKMCEVGQKSASNSELIGFYSYHLNFKDFFFQISLILFSQLYPHKMLAKQQQENQNHEMNYLCCFRNDIATSQNQYKLSKQKY